MNQIPSFPNYYATSTGDIYNSSGKVLSKRTDRYGYVHTRLSVDGKKIERNNHRLVMEAFSGADSRHVNHINGDKADNNLTNLEYCTREENTRHAFKTGLVKYKLSFDKAEVIREMVSSGQATRAEMAKEYMVSIKTIADVIYNRLWTKPII